MARVIRWPAFCQSPLRHRLSAACSSASYFALAAALRLLVSACLFLNRDQRTGVPGFSATFFVPKESVNVQVTVIDICFIASAEQG
jgi:hypothetical protein